MVNELDCPAGVTKLAPTVAVPLRIVGIGLQAGCGGAFAHHAHLHHTHTVM